MAAKYSIHAVMAGALLTLGLAASPALACKGAQTLLRDDFTDEDPAWNLPADSNAQIGEGALKLKSDAGHFENLIYQGLNFPAADACIDIIAPSGKPSPDVQAGFGIWTGKAWNYIYIATDGTAGVAGLQGGYWTNPVPTRKFDGIKTTPNAVNQLRVVWQAPPPSNSTASPDPSVTIFINDKQFIKYKTAPNPDRELSIYAESGGGTFQFKNLAITD